jgi:uroporphyrinogen III methyltransferase/synthase
VVEAPLAGRRVAVTRPREHAGFLTGRLAELGAEVDVVPLISIEPVEQGGDFAELVERGGHDWVVFTSANAVRAVGALLPAAKARFAAVGPVTGETLRELGLEPSFVPERFAAEEIAAGLEPLEGARVLLPQSEIAESLLADELRARGASVDVVEAYRTVARRPPEAEIETLRAAEAILLASGSAARSLAALESIGDTVVLCIGPKTAAVAREAGLEVALVADEATAEGMIEALVSHFGGST